jgi:SpoVK/Ycf46/Vps4 family AAA+-type ATPase
MLLLGVQGAGKSLAARAVAGSWRVPLLRLDFGALYNKFHGETERNLRAALETAAQMAPCVLWLDEIEKGVAAATPAATAGCRAACWARSSRG